MTFHIYNCGVKSANSLEWPSYLHLTSVKVCTVVKGKTLLIYVKYVNTERQHQKVCFH